VPRQTPAHRHQVSLARPGRSRQSSGSHGRSAAGPPRLAGESFRWRSTAPSVTLSRWPGFGARSPPGAHGHRPTHEPDPRPAMSDSSARGRLHWCPDISLGLRPRREYACGRCTARPHRRPWCSQYPETRLQDRGQPTGGSALHWRICAFSARVRVVGGVQFLAAHA